MIEDMDAAAGRTANGEAMPFTNRLSNVRRAKDGFGRPILVATSQATRASIFAKASGDIDSETIIEDFDLITDRVRSIIWCMRILDEEAGRDLEKIEKAGRVVDTLLDALGSWMDDLDEVGRLAAAHRWQGLRQEK